MWGVMWTINKLGRGTAGLSDVVERLQSRSVRRERLSCAVRMAAESGERALRLRFVATECAAHCPR